MSQGTSSLYTVAFAASKGRQTQLVGTQLSSLGSKFHLFFEAHSRRNILKPQYFYEPLGRKKQFHWNSKSLVGKKNKTQCMEVLGLYYKPETMQKSECHRRSCVIFVCFSTWKSRTLNSVRLSWGRNSGRIFMESHEYECWTGPCSLSSFSESVV